MYLRLLDGFFCSGRFPAQVSCRTKQRSAGIYYAIITWASHIRLPLMCLRLYFAIALWGYWKYIVHVKAQI